MQHQRRVEREFTRQAESFAASATLTAAELTERLAATLGEARLGRILDAACGPGLLSTALSPRAEQVVSVDLTSEMLRVARRRRDEAGLGNVLLARSLVEQLPFAPASFDAAVLRLALHHFDHPDAALRSVRAVLRPGARLALLDLLGCEDPETARLHDAIERLRDPSHHALVPEARLRGLVCGAGFRVERCETWSRPREVREWASIVADAERGDALEVVLRQLCRAGVSAGIELREVDGALWMTYRWCLLVAVAAPDGEA